MDVGKITGEFWIEEEIELDSADPLLSGGMDSSVLERFLLDCFVRLVPEAEWFAMLKFAALGGIASLLELELPPKPWE